MSSKTLYITLLASEWKSSKGGLSTMNRELAIQLAKQPNVSVSFFVPKCCDKDKTAASRHDVRIFEAKERPGYEPVDWLAFPPKDLAIDFVVGHGVGLGKQAQIIKDSHHCKWAQVVHTAPDELAMYKSYSDAIPKGDEKQRIELQLCDMADLVIAVGPKLMESYSALLRSSRKRVYNFTPGIFTEFSSLELPLQSGKKFRLLVFGRGDCNEDFELKGYDIAAEAVAKLNDKSYHLTFVGAPNGSETQVTDKLLQHGLVRSQLIVKGYLEDREYLTKLLCASNLVVIPSRTEGFGLTALEALSAGLPFLVSQNSGFGEALQEISFGSTFIVDSEDPEKWAEAIKRVRQKGSETSIQECQELRARYAEKYSWETQCDKLLKVMLSMVNGDNPRKKGQMDDYQPPKRTLPQKDLTPPPVTAAKPIAHSRSDISFPEIPTAKEQIKSPNTDKKESETNVKSTKTEGNSSDIQTQTPQIQKAQNRHEKEEVPMHPAVETNETEHSSFVFVTEESMDTSLDNVKLEHMDVPVDDSLNKPAPARLPDFQEVDTSASSLQESLAILYRNQTDIAAIKDVFGDVLLAISPITSKDPSDLKALLDTLSVRSCFIIVEAIKMREELCKKSHGTPYQDLLRTVNNTVGRKVVVILCNKGSGISLSEKDAITAVIEELLGEKGCILWQLGKENVSVPSPQEQQQTEEDMDLSYDCYIDVSHNDIPMEESLNKPTPADLPDAQTVDTSASSLPSRVAILYRDKTDIATIKDVFGDVSPAILSITSNDPSSLRNELLAQSVRSCFIIVETLKMKKELDKKSHSVPYQDLLKTASSTVGRKVVVILCDKGRNISPSEEEAITTRIEQFLAEKGLIVWWKGTKSCPETKRSLFSISKSHSCPDGHDGTGKKLAKKGTPAQVASPINSEELILHTRLRHGRISYDQRDVKVRPEEWTAPQNVTDDLLKKFQFIANAELQVYRETETGKETAVVNKGITSHFTGAWETVVGLASGSNIGSTIGNYFPSLGGSSNTPPADNNAPPTEDELVDLPPDL